MGEGLEFLEYRVAGLRVGDMLEALLAVFVGFVAAKIVERLFLKAGDRAPEGTIRRALLHAVGKPAGWAPLLAGIWFAANLFPLPPIVDGQRNVVFDLGDFVSQLFQGATLALLIWFGLRLTDALTEIWAVRAELTEGTFDDQLVPIVRKGLKVFLVIIGIVMVIENLGGDVTSLVAGVGLGGAALALASKDTVANLFGSIVIFVDRPFQIGDWVEINEVEGTVEEVGLRVTRVRTFANSLITVPNSMFTTESINNWSRMRKRRIKLTLGITYDAKADQMNEAVEAIRKVLREDDRIAQDFFLVNFTDFGPSSLDIFVYCFTTTTNWTEYLQVRQEVLLKFMTEVERLGLGFAFPTQTVHIEGLDKPGATPPAMTRQLPR